jgi:hypothetical protein
MRGALGYWLRHNTYNLRVTSLNHHCGDHISGIIHLDQSLEQNLIRTLSWHFCIRYNSANERVDFKEWLAYTHQNLATEKIENSSN